MIVLILISIAALVVVIDVVVRWFDKEEPRWKCIVATVVGLLLIGGIVLQSVDAHKAEAELRQFRNVTEAARFRVSSSTRRGITLRSVLRV